MTVAAATGEGWDCTGSTATVVSCVFGSTLGVGDAPLVHVTVNVAAGTADDVVNTASVSDAATDPNADNNQANDPTHVITATPPSSTTTSTTSTSTTTTSTSTTTTSTSTSSTTSTTCTTSTTIPRSTTTSTTIADEGSTDLDIDNDVDVDDRFPVRPPQPRARQRRRTHRR